MRPSCLKVRSKCAQSALKVLQGSLKLPHGALKLPEGSLKVQQGSLKLPQGSLKLPQGASHLRFPEFLQVLKNASSNSLKSLILGSKPSPGDITQNSRPHFRIWPVLHLGVESFHLSIFPYLLTSEIQGGLREFPENLKPSGARARSFVALM